MEMLANAVTNTASASLKFIVRALKSVKYASNIPQLKICVSAFNHPHLRINFKRIHPPQLRIYFKRIHPAATHSFKRIHPADTHSFKRIHSNAFTPNYAFASPQPHPHFQKINTTIILNINFFNKFKHLKNQTKHYILPVPFYICCFLLCLEF